MYDMVLALKVKAYQEPGGYESLGQADGWGWQRPFAVVGKID